VSAAARRRVRIFYTSLAVMVVVAAAGLALLTSLSPALFTLGFGFLIIAVTALMADAAEGAQALVRTGRLTTSERRMLVYGIAATALAVITMVVEFRLGGNGWTSAIFATSLATGTGLFGLAALTRE